MSSQKYVWFSREGMRLGLHHEEMRCWVRVKVPYRQPSSVDWFLRNSSARIRQTMCQSIASLLIVVHHHRVTQSPKAHCLFSHFPTSFIYIYTCRRRYSFLHIRYSCPEGKVRYGTRNDYRLIKSHSKRWITMLWQGPKTPFLTYSYGQQ